MNKTEVELMSEYEQPDEPVENGNGIKHRKHTELAKIVSDLMAVVAGLMQEVKVIKISFDF